MSHLGAGVSQALSEKHAAWQDACGYTDTSGDAVDPQPSFVLQPELGDHATPDA